MSKIIEPAYTKLEKLEVKIVNFFSKQSTMAVFALITIIIMFNIEGAEAKDNNMEIISYQKSVE